MSYRQGLDLLCAPLVALYPNNDALSFACTNAIIKRYLPEFYHSTSTNSGTGSGGDASTSLLDRHLLLFSQMLQYHDPQLCYHLSSISYTSDLFAYSWLFTLFASKLHHPTSTIIIACIL
jgi:hypothetical protein